MGCFAAPEVRKCHTALARWAKPSDLLPGEKREGCWCKSRQRARWCQQWLCSGWGVSAREEGVWGRAKAARWAEASESACPCSATFPFGVPGFWKCTSCRLPCASSRSASAVLHFVPFLANINLWTQPLSLPSPPVLVSTSEMQFSSVFPQSLKDIHTWWFCH